MTMKLIKALCIVIIIGMGTVLYTSGQNNTADKAVCALSGTLVTCTSKINDSGMYANVTSDQLAGYCRQGVKVYLKDGVAYGKDKAMWEVICR